jgi:ABC-type sugar transport system ATPase subunit
MNLLPCVVDRGEFGPTIRIADLDDAAPLAFSSPIDQGSSRVEIGFRPEQLSIRPADSSAPTAIASIRRLEPMGHESIAFLDLGPHPLAVRLPSRHPFQVGDRVMVDLDLDLATWFDAATGARLA